VLSAKLNLSKHSRTTDTRSVGTVNFIENNSVDNNIVFNSASILLQKTKSA
jgi:hypothetical protein